LIGSLIVEWFFFNVTSSVAANKRNCYEQRTENYVEETVLGLFEGSTPVFMYSDE
jgi:hypothetical protein